MKKSSIKKVALFALVSLLGLHAFCAQNEKRVLFLGDSITDKMHVGCTTNYWGFLGVRYGFEPLVYGVNGQQMCHIVEYQAKKYLKDHPDGADVVFVFAGTNDFNDNVPLGEWYTLSDETVNKNGKQVKLRKRTLNYDTNTFRGRINQAFLYLKENFPNAWIIALTPVHRGFANFGPRNVQPDESYANTAGLFIDDYVNAIKEAGPIWSVKVVDLYATSGLVPNLRSQDALIAKPDRDRLHPSTTGHKRIADAIALEVGELLKSEK